MPPRQKLELADCVDRVIHMFNVEKMSCKDISSQLKKDGVSVSYSTVARTVRLNNNEIERQRLRMQETRLAMEAMKEDLYNESSTHLEQTVLMNSMLKDRLIRTLSDEELSGKEAESLTYQVASISKTLLDFEKLKDSRGLAIDEAKKAIDKSLREFLKERDPELLLRLVTLVKEMKIEQQRKGGKLIITSNTGQ